MKTWHGKCHCGDVSFSFQAEGITDGLRCNCSICKRKSALMSSFVIPIEDISIDVVNDALSVYQFDSGVAKHYFCKHCGIYPFHETMRAPGNYRLNLGCIDEVDAFSLPFEVFDGASL